MEGPSIYFVSAGLHSDTLVLTRHRVNSWLCLAQVYLMALSDVRQLFILLHLSAYDPFRSASTPEF